MKILVTGGSGLVGRFVVGELSKIHETDILDRNPPPIQPAGFYQADILDLKALAGLLQGYDAVVHLAGIPHPLNDPPETVFRVNALGTFNVLEACASAGIRRFIFMSSESTLGFAFSTTRMWPLSVPIDEHHALRPQDPYGLSKVTCELLCAGFSRRTGMQTLCLRAPWIWCPVKEEIARYKELIQDYPKWYKNLWAWIHVRDVARAIMMALEVSTDIKHEVMFISAEENWTGRESRMLMQEFYPETRQVAESLTGSQSLLSFAKAGRIMGFHPVHTASDLLEPPNTQ
jgi:UDP-glucose 4-epimerase